MAYITRCPTCGCVYQVSAEELQSDGGYCRCGICQSRFDAKQSLREINDHTLLALIRGEDAPRPEAEESAPAASACPSHPPLSSIAPQGRLQPQEKNKDQRRSPVLTAFAPRLRTFESRKPGSPLAWGLASLVLLLVISWQILSLFGPAMSRHVPGILALRQAACGTLPCPGPGSDQANPFSIDGFQLKLQSLDRYEIDFTLENNGTEAESLPQVSVTFNDEKGIVLLRRILKPGEYAGRSAQDEIPANGALPVRFTFGLAGDRPASCEVKALPGA